MPSDSAVQVVLLALGITRDPRPVVATGELPMDLNALLQSTMTTLVAAAWKIGGAIALWIVGRMLITFALRLLDGAFAKQKFDVTLTRYIHTALKILLNVALAVAILGFFGVE